MNVNSVSLAKKGAVSRTSARNPSVKVSIITVVLNCRPYIEACIKSVLGQTYKNVEYIIIDGGSTDGTLDIIKKYEKHISSWVSEPDFGTYDALNKGISLAKGDVIGILNADDFYSHNHVLSKIVQSFNSNQVDSCYGDLEYTDPDDLNNVVRRWRSGPYRDRCFYRGWMPPHPTFFVRQEIYRKYGVFNLALGTSADYELMLRLLEKHQISTTYIPEVLVRMRVGGQSNESFKNRVAANRMDRLAWNINELKPYPLTIWMKPLRKVTQFLPSLTNALNDQLLRVSSSIGRMFQQPTRDHKGTAAGEGARSSRQPYAAFQVIKYTLLSFFS